MAPSNALCIVQSEISLLSTAVKCDSRFPRGYQDDTRNPMYKGFLQLKCTLNSVSTLNEVEPLVYLTPFLEVIRSEYITGPITGLALNAVDKFLSYGLLEVPDADSRRLQIDGPGSINSVARAAEAIAESGTQARFVGTDRGSDEVVLMKVLHLLRTLLLVPAGCLISDRVVREILQSCFRICFEPKLSELLRRTAELCLASIMQLFFSRLPSIVLMAKSQSKLSEIAGLRNEAYDPCVSPTWMGGKSSTCLPNPTNDTLISDESLAVLPDVSGDIAEAGDDLANLCHQTTVSASEPTSSGPDDLSVSSVRTPSQVDLLEATTTVSNVDVQTGIIDKIDSTAAQSERRISSPVIVEDPTPVHPQPYGFPAVHDLLRYLIGLLTPEHNSDAIISVALGLVTIALETGADAISKCPSLLQLVQGDLSKHLLLLLYSDRVSLFAATLRVCFMLFESMRKHLKLQMEIYLQRLVAICSPDNESTSYERREIALESVVRVFLVPGLTTELYVNYDCDPYCSNLFEDITKMLAKNAYPVDRLTGAHLLALDALLAVLNTIGTRCTALGNASSDHHGIGCSLSAHVDDDKVTSGKLRPPASPSIPLSGSEFITPSKIRFNRHSVDLTELPPREQLNASKVKKKTLMLGSDQFNVKPKQGIAFLQQYGVLRDPLDPDELAQFLRENPRLDKRMIGEYLSDRNNEHILSAYVRQFNFSGVSIENALRIYLETFRLPGEAPLIQRLMEHFAEHWYLSNGAPFADVDSAFTLAYAILMLNTDQHNPNSKKQNAPMNVLEFTKNLNGMNGTGDFDAKLLETIFNNIKKHEIVMPSEQAGLVRENYLWKCLLRRASTPQAHFIHVETDLLDADLFDLIWGPTVSALSFIFDKTIDPAVQSKAVHGFIRCAAIAAHHGMSDVLDNLVISLCKFTTLLTAGESPSSLPVSMGRNAKGRLALHLVFALVSSHADILRYGWHSLLDCILQLFRANLLTGELTESEDFLSPSRRVRLTTNGCVPIFNRTKRKSGRGSVPGSGQSHREGGVLSTFYQYLTSGSTWNESGDDDELDEPLPVDPSEVLELDGCNVKSIPIEPYVRLQDQLRSEFWMNAVLCAQLDEQQASRLALETVHQCDIPQLLKDSKFLIEASLIELIKALLRAVHGDSCNGTAPMFTNVMPDSMTNLSEDSTSLRQSRLGDSSISSHRSTTDTCAMDLGQQDASGVLKPNPLDSSRPIRRSMTLPTAASHYSPFCSMGGGPTEDCRIFCLELLIRVLLYNKDRVYMLWPLVQCYLADLLLSAVEPTPLNERVIVGFLRLAISLLRRHEVTGQIFACLHYVLLTRGDKLLLGPNAASGPAQQQRAQFNRPNQTRPSANPNSPNRIGLQITAAISQLLRDHAADLPDPSADWQLIFNLLEVCGAGLRAQPSLMNRSRHAHHSSMHDIAVARATGNSSSRVFRGYTSDGEAPHAAYLHDQGMNKSTSGICSNQDSSKHTASDGVLPPAARLLRQSSDNPDAAWVLIDVASPEPSETATSGIHSIGLTKDAFPSDCTKNLAVSEAHGTKDTVPAIVRPSFMVPSSVLRLRVTIGSRDPVTLKQAMDCLDFLIRDPAHVTPDNFEHCVRTLRIFVETCLRRQPKWVSESSVANLGQPKASNQRTLHKWNGRSSTSHKVASSTGRNPVSDSDSDAEDQDRRMRKDKWTAEASLNPTTGIVAIQLLDLIHLLFKRSVSIHTEWTRTGPSALLDSPNPSTTEPAKPDMQYLWTSCWCPLLQATARLCCDYRREVRTDALAYLQRCLLSPDLQSLSGCQWEDCFDKILFPLLSGFLESIAVEEAVAAANAQVDFLSGRDSGSASPSNVHFHMVEFVDPRMRAIPLLTKVFLLNLRPLHQSANFHSLWVRILAYMEHYMHVSSTDSLTDAVRESLKNVLLVMYTGTYDTPSILQRDAPAESQEAILWNVTAKHLSSFLPSLLDQLFPVAPPPDPIPTRQTSQPPLNDGPSVVTEIDHEPEEKTNVDTSTVDAGAGFATSEPSTDLPKAVAGEHVKTVSTEPPPQRPTYGIVQDL